jgi:hypothetical protein
MLVEQEALNVANYWRASLADAALGRGSFGDADIQGFVPISDAELTEGQLSENLTSAIFATESETVLAKSVILRPYIYRSVMSHAERHAARTHVITPLACKGTVDRKGKLSLPNFVGVPRDLLAPLDRKTETIGELGDLDDFLTRFPSPNDFARQSEAETSWQLLRRYCRELAKAVFPDLDNDSRFKRVEGGFLDPSDAADAVKAIIPIYDLMMDEPPAAPLFDTFAAKGETESSAMLPRGDGFARRLAHASTRYALADAQRTALDHLLVAEHGDITTVNGPPGNGQNNITTNRRCHTLGARGTGRR